MAAYADYAEFIRRKLRLEALLHICFEAFRSSFLESGAPSYTKIGVGEYNDKMQIRKL